MTIEMIEKLARRSDRSQFLAKAGAASLAALAGSLAVRPEAAHAQFQHGCFLCDPDTAACPSNVACFWCWWGDCHINPGGTVRHRTQCCEGYKSGYPCNGHCDPGQGFACSAFGGQTGC